MTTQCIFCQLSQGQGTCHNVYEDDHVFAFLDKHPIHPGHVLVIPKTHVVDFYDLADDSYSNLWLAIKRISKMVHKTMQPKKVGLVVAGFDVPHAHVHVVPMHEYHDITSKSVLE